MASSAANDNDPNRKMLEIVRRRLGRIQVNHKHANNDSRVRRELQMLGADIDRFLKSSALPPDEKVEQ